MEKVEGKTYYKPQYKCGVCSKVYDNISDRAKCENACLKKQEEDAKKAAEAKKLAEKDARYAEIKMLNKQIHDLDNKLRKNIRSYLDDYGHIELDDKIFNESWEHNINKLLGWWL